MNIPVVVYGCGLTGKIFHEDTSLRIWDGERADLNVSELVEPGQEFILMYLASDEERRCRVISVEDSLEGNCVASVKFVSAPKNFE